LPRGPRPGALHSEEVLETRERQQRQAGARAVRQECLAHHPGARRCVRSPEDVVEVVLFAVVPIAFGDLGAPRMYAITSSGSNVEPGPARIVWSEDPPGAPSAIHNLLWEACP